jgi:hypothetical protein
LVQPESLDYGGVLSLVPIADDTIAAAAAIELDAVILTADPELQMIEERAVIEWLPR